MKSENGDLYVGSCEDILKRIGLHNGGRVKSTKGHRPWELQRFEEFSTRNEAVRREKFLKTGQQKEILKKKFGAVAKW